jgi:nitrogen regulatory protein P-II 1
MKMIVAVIPPERLEAVKNQLASIDVYRLTVMDVQGFGTVKPNTEGKGREAEMNLTRRVQLLVGVNEEFLEPTIEAIRNGINTAPDVAAADGKIFVLPLHDCIRIRTGEHGGEAI